MSDFDDLKQMAEDVDQLGNEPPTPEEVQEAEAPAEPQAPAEGDADATPPHRIDPEMEEVTTGGLGDDLIPEEDRNLDIDKLLGLEKPQGEELPKQDEQTAPEPEEQAPAPGSVDERIKELSESNRRLLEQNEMLMKKALGDQEQHADEVEDPEIDPDVLDYLKPVIEHLVGKDLKAMKQDIEPIKQKTHDGELGQFIATQVDGFKPSDVAVLRQELDKMPEQEQALYRDRASGAILLALKLQNRGAFGGPRNKQQRTSPLAARHVSESTGTAPAGQDEMSEDEKIRKLMKADPATIAAMVDGLEGY